MPCWYELFLRDGHFLRISVHREMMDELGDIPWDTAPVVKDIIDRHHVTSFTPPAEFGAWGFDEVFTTVESTDPDFVMWEIEIPQLKKNQVVQDRALKEMRARCNLYILFFILNYPKIETSSTKKQLIVIECLCLPTGDRSFAQGSLSASLSPTAVSWIRTQPQGHIEPIIDAMRIAHDHLWKSHFSERFGAYHRGEGFFWLDVPGDACDIAPERYHDDETGYCLVPHNVDSGVQQITFLVGLAKLHELIRADGF